MCSGCDESEVVSQPPRTPSPVDRSLAARIRVSRRPSEWLVIAVALSLLTRVTFAGDAVLPPAPIGGDTTLEEANDYTLSQAYFQLLRELRATHHTVQQNREEAKEVAALAAATMSNALYTAQTSFAAQRARDLRLIEESNRLTLKVAGELTGLGFIALFVLACLQWRMSRGLAEISSVFPATSGHSLAALGRGGTRELGVGGAAPQLLGRLREPERVYHAGPRSHKRTGRSIERWLFPRPGDSLRRRQFRALRNALLVGLVFAGVVALVLYLVSAQPHL
jgi:hypothetical protein